MPLENKSGGGGRGGGGALSIKKFSKGQCNLNTLCFEMSSVHIGLWVHLATIQLS